MPRITKTHMKESIVTFADDAIKIIKENINLDDMENREDKPTIEYNGWYYYIHKSVSIIKPEIRIQRQNYRQGNTRYLNDHPKGNRISEEAWIYKEGMNRRNSKDKEFIIDGFSIQDYKKKMF